MSEAICGPWPDRVSAKRALGARVRALRRDRGWKQADLARRADLSRNVVHTTENGHSYPTADNLARLARALGVPVGALAGKPPMGGYGEPSSSCAFAASAESGFARIQIDRLVRAGTAVAILKLIVEDEPPSEAPPR